MNVKTYDELAEIICDSLGPAFAEEINNALHYYWAHPEWWGGVRDEYEDEFMKLLRAFDRANLNYFLPPYDVLRGGSLTEVCKCEPHA